MLLLDVLLHARSRMYIQPEIFGAVYTSSATKVVISETTMVSNSNVYTYWMLGSYV